MLAPTQLKIFILAASSLSLALSVTPASSRRYFFASLPQEIKDKDYHHVSLRKVILGNDCGIASTQNNYISNARNFGEEDYRNLKSVFSYQCPQEKAVTHIGNTVDRELGANEAIQLSLQQNPDKGLKVINSMWYDESPLSLITLKLNADLQKYVDIQQHDFRPRLMQGSEFTKLLPVLTIDVGSKKIPLIYLPKIQTLVAKYFPQGLREQYFEILDSEVAMLAFAIPQIDIKARKLLLLLSLALILIWMFPIRRKQILIAALATSPLVVHLLPFSSSLALSVSVLTLIATITNRSCRKSIVLMNVGILVSLIGLALSLYYGYRHYSQVTAYQVPGSSFKYSEDSDYGNPVSRSSLNWISDKDDPLGYRYPRNSSGSSTRVEIGQNGEKLSTVYDVTYSTDERGNRSHLKAKKALTRRKVVFLGDSFMFGEGLNDNQTLPYIFQENTGFDAFNLGMHGYGVHQALTIMRRTPHVVSRLPRGPISLFVVRVIPDHLIRSSGRAGWDQDSMQYRIDSFGGIIPSTAFALAVERIQYPISSLDIFKKFLMTHPVLSGDRLASSIAKVLPESSVEKTDFNRVIGIIKAMNSIAMAEQSNFVVILDEAFSGARDCKQEKSSFTTKSERALAASSIPFISTADVYRADHCRTGRLVIANDGHPTELANASLSIALASYIKENFPAEFTEQ